MSTPYSDTALGEARRTIAANPDTIGMTVQAWHQLAADLLATVEALQKQLLQVEAERDAALAEWWDQGPCP